MLNNHLSSKSDNSKLDYSPSGGMGKGPSIADVKKVHTTTVALVPPEEYTEVWDKVTNLRRELRDPGLYRWPPHVNLLYPFVNFLACGNDSVGGNDSSDVVKDIERALLLDMEARSDKDEINGTHILQQCSEYVRSVTKQIEPFEVSLDHFGTFGNSKRGVLWLYPSSIKKFDDSIDHCDAEPLIYLQNLLQGAFPNCDDQQKNAGQFNPHMTLSHFVSLEDAEIAKEKHKSSWKSQSFICHEIYIMQRIGDGGQFHIAATIKMGKHHDRESEHIIIHHPPKRFAPMPEHEEDWVHKERMHLKERRNNRARRKGSSRPKPGPRRGASRSTDTPEEIAAKRAARKAKRERLEQERLEALMHEDQSGRKKL